LFGHRDKVWVDAHDSSMPNCKNQLIVLLLLLSLSSLDSSRGATPTEIERALAAYRNGAIETALSLLEPAAREGNAESQFILGAIYLEDHGVPADPSVSTRWYRAAAEQGHVEAQFSLGNAYLHGRGVGVDLSVARHWWHLAAHGGSAAACVNLAVHHIQRAKQPARGELGRAWLLRAIELGSGQAEAYLALLESSEADKAPDRSRDWDSEPLRSEATVLVADPDAVTLQLLSTASRDAAQAFVERHAIGDRALLFRLPKDNKLLWNVVYGEYSSRTEAAETIEQMRPALRRTGPWPRPLREVQAAVRSVWSEQEGIAPDLLP
jgi:hypothetical protein